ncbi:MAG: monooxygenase, partial [Rhodospirillaceae bacterium]|nr:monooxygenase [Rhodospirillaceae bacterium]
MIAGGGIAGLATALAFQLRGWEVQVVERAVALREVGAGIQLSPNGTKVLRALGLERAVLERGFLPEALQMRMGRSGFSIFRLPIKTAAPYRWRAPYVHIHRADLID